MKKTQAGYITKHKNYIDYRVKLISDYVSLNSKTDLASIMRFLINFDKLDTNQFSEEVFSALIDLKYLIDKWDIIIDGDIVGYIYQAIQNKNNKNTKGQYFTPDDIVNYLVKQTLKKNMTVFDPACGSGQFLISLFKEMIKLNNGNPGDVYNKEYLELSKSILKKYVYGTDLDPIAVSLAKYNLSKISGLPVEEVNIFNVDFLNKTDKNIDNLMEIKFDLIIGNPPWGSRLNEDQKKYYKTHYASAKSGINTFSLFIEKSYDLLRKDGVIAYLIPEAYLNIKAHMKSREIVLQSCCINEIAVWGERFKGVYAPSISIILNKENDDTKRKKNIVNIKTGKNIHDGTSILVPQASYYFTPENIFNINYSRKAVNIISQIDEQDCVSLKNRAKFFLGIVTGSNEKFIQNEKTEEKPDPIIIGKDIVKYNINFSGHYFKFDTQKLQQVAPIDLYKTEKKILYKFIGRKLTFALDLNQNYMLNNVNGFIPELTGQNIETTLSILNSRVMQYYYDKNFFTVKVLRGNLERLPLKLIQNTNQEKIKKLVYSIIASREGSTEKLQENIEDIIFHEYGIKDREAYMLMDQE